MNFKAIIFDFFDVLEDSGAPNLALLDYIETHLKSYKIGLISNSSGVVVRRLLTNHIKHFDVMIISAEVGLAKPEPAIYRMAAQKLGVQPDECIYIDNHDYRVEGAEKAGMTGIVYRGFEPMKQDLERHLATNA